MRISINLLLFYCIFFFLSTLCRQVLASLNFPSNEQLKVETFPSCAACKILIESFKKGIEKTKRGKFEGGDTAWEEDKLKGYAKSEVRLTEIQENLCKDLTRGETQCQNLAEELENVIEDWWFKHQEAYPDIFVYICIKHTKKCCPKDHYGPECAKCPGFPDRVCNNNGKCKGAGTRKGNGQCLCDKNYTGETCSECAVGYYESYRDEDKLLCSACHPSCMNGCKGGGPTECQGGCKEGWQLVADKGCIDINECLESEIYCSGNQFCINKDGNYTCLNCDRACDGCTGDGPDMCIRCSDGYHKKDNVCINSDILGRKKTENMARYATYLGLCIATCIIFQQNVFAASAIGLMVALYISVSEYMIANTDVQNPTPNVDIVSPID